MRTDRARLLLCAALLLHATAVVAWDPDKDPLFAPRPRSTGFPEPRACPGKDPILKEIAEQLESWLMPTYPAAALAEGWENDVELHVEMDETGKVTSILPRTGDPPFQDEAWRALRKWKFRPCLRADGKPSRCSIDLTICFVAGKVTVTGVILPPPPGAAPGHLPRWRALAGTKGYPKPPPHGTVAWALNVGEAISAARKPPASSESLIDAYDRLFIAYGECQSCRLYQYRLLEDGLRSYFNDQAAINRVKLEEQAEAAMAFPEGHAEADPACESCRRELSCVLDLARPLAAVHEYLLRCRTALRRCPKRDELWWSLAQQLAGSRNRDGLEALLQDGPPGVARPRVLLFLSDLVRDRDPDAARELEHQAYRDPELPSIAAEGDVARRVALSEQRRDYQNALFLMLVAGPPMVTCGNDTFSIPSYQFEVARLKILAGIDAKTEWRHLMAILPKEPRSDVLRNFLNVVYLDKLLSAARAARQEAELLARLESLRLAVSDARQSQPLTDPYQERASRDAEQLLGGYIAELRGGHADGGKQ